MFFEQLSRIVEQLIDLLLGPSIFDDDFVLLVFKLAEQIRPACQAGNPAFVPIGDSGKFVLAYAVEHAARVSGMSRSDLVAQMAKKGDKFPRYAERTQLLSLEVLDLLDSATVER